MQLLRGVMKLLEELRGAQRRPWIPGLLVQCLAGQEALRPTDDLLIKLGCLDDW